MNQSQLFKNDPIFMKISEKIQTKDLINNGLTFQQAKYLIQKSQQTFQSQPILLHLNAPLKIIGIILSYFINTNIGDIYGNYSQLLKLLQLCFYSSSSYNILFLGNYIDKSQHSLQTLLTLLYYKIKYSLNIFMLRGKHQISENNKIYGLFKQCQRKYKKQLWVMINQMFNYMPVGAVLEKQIFCVCSGVSDRIINLQQISQINRPLYIKSQLQLQSESESQSIKYVYQLLCSKICNNNNNNNNDTNNTNPNSTTHKIQQPQSNNNNHNNKNNFTTQQKIKQFLNNNNLSLILCSNQIFQNGFQFSANNQILTICSIPNLFGLANLGTILSIDQDLKCQFIVVKMTNKKVD